MRKLGIAATCLWILSCTNASEVVWVDDGGPSNGGSDSDTDTDSDIDTDDDSDDDSDSDTDTDTDYWECENPCEDPSGYWVPGCMEPCGGFVGENCSNPELTCMYWEADIGVCVPYDALDCNAPPDCYCFPIIFQCEKAGGYSYWECESGICNPHCYS